MGFADLPHELIEQILTGCDLRQILRCKLVCKSLFNLVDDSALLNYCVDLAISGFEDDRLKAIYNLNDRRSLLSSAQAVWAGSAPAILLETLNVSNLEYWPIRDSVLLRKLNFTLQALDPTSKENAVIFDISRISSRLELTGLLSHWQVQLPSGTGNIACIDAPQNLLIVRSHEPIASDLSVDPSTARDWYSLSVHSLKTGMPHPRARHPHLRFKMSRRVVKNPHYTRVQVFDNVLAVNMASGFQLFTETTFFDWTSGEQKAFFSSPGTSARAWGHPAVLVSDRSFLQPCYSSAERRPAIEVYALDDSTPLKSDEVARPARHVATYWLPRVTNGDVRLVINVTSRRQVSPGDDDGGFLLSSSYARMLHVQVTGVWFTSPFQCAFFTPAHQFIDEANRFFALPIAERGSFIPRNRPWATWGNTSTRWLEEAGPEWHDQARSNLRGSGSRYAFPKFLIDFAPADVAREVHQYHQSHPSDTLQAFPSKVAGWTTHAYVATKSEISGADMFEEDVLSSLPYREREIPQLPEFEPGSDVLLVNDKIVTVEGGVTDIIKIYMPTVPPALQSEDEEHLDDVDEITAALNAVTL